MSCESVVLLFAVIFANAGETKLFLIIEFKMQKVILVSAGCTTNCGVF